MTDDRLRDHLHAAVPEPPEAPDRARDVRDRVRRTRRRTTIGVVVGAATVVAMLAGVPLLANGDGSGAGPTAPSPSPTTQAAGDFTCPRPRAEADTDTVPGGAVAVHLCRGRGTGFDAPTDALVAHVDELADLVNAQPTMPPPSACRADLGPGYLLVFEYDDGTVVPVGGELYGCAELRVGSSTREHPERPWRRFIQLLRAQRAASSPPTTPVTRPGCDGRWFDSSPVARPGEMVAATLCVRYETETGHEPVGVPVPDDDLTVLLADRAARTNPVPASGDCALDTAHWQLIGTTAWGDKTLTDGWCGLWQDDRGGAWAPGPRAQRILDRLITEAGRPRPAVDASSSAADVVAAYADLLNLGDRAGAARLWRRLGTPDLPTAYSHVDAKVDGVRRLRFVSAYQDATAVTALYREVPPDGRYTDYREATFTLGRDEKGVFRIVGLQVGGVVPTGR